MPVDLKSPSGSSVTPPIQFVWNSTDGSYCYDNYIDIFDQSGNLIIQSGNFNPNGGDSVFTVQSLPAGTSGISYAISCNPNQTQVGSYSSGSNAGNTSSGNDSNETGSDGDNVSSTDGSVSIVLEAPESIALDFGSGLTPDEQSQISGALMLTLIVPFGVAIILKMLR